MGMAARIASRRLSSSGKAAENLYIKITNTSSIRESVPAILVRWFSKEACPLGHKGNEIHHYSNPSYFQPHRSIFSLAPPSSVSRAVNLVSIDCRAPGAIGLGGMRSFSDDVSHMPSITDPRIENVFKDLMAASWNELPDAPIHDAKTALSQSTDDKSGQETLVKVLRAAEAVEEFGGILTTMKMELDDAVGMTGENVKNLTDEFVNALRVAHQRYIAYLDSFGPDETYLRKKVETELGSKMIYLKMRCSGLGSEWGKISVLGTSGLSGSYIEQRA